MLDSILTLSLKNRVFVLAISLIVTVVGLFQAARMPIDVLPDLNRPTVTIMTETHGQSAENVEKLVTWPLEQALIGAPQVFRVRSKSVQGLSIVNVEFVWGSDLYLNRQIVSERIQSINGQLPLNSQPQLAPVSSLMGQIQLIGFQVDENQLDKESRPYSLLELRNFIDQEVVPKLLTVGGVAQVLAIGGQPVEARVELDLNKIKAERIALSELQDNLANINLTSSGLTINRNSTGATTTFAGLLATTREIENTIVGADSAQGGERGRSLKISDVGSVFLGPSEYMTGTAGINGRQGVIVIVSKQPGVDTVSLSRAIESELDQLSKQLPNSVQINSELFRQADFIERAIDNVIVSVRDGAILVVIILVLFLANFRTTVITLSAIPISLGATAIVFWIFGQTINTMTLGGIAVAVGTLVDDAIVDVENVYRRLYENRCSQFPKPLLSVILKASIEIRKPVVVGTLLVTVVYMPLFFLDGIEGRLFMPIGLAYITAVFMSLLVAMTVTPVLCSFLLSAKNNSQQADPGPENYGTSLTRLLQKSSEIFVNFSIDNSFFLLLTILLVFSLVVLHTLQIGSSFLPEFNEGSAQVNLILPPGTDIETSSEFGKRLEQSLIGIEGVGHVSRRTGRAPGDSHAMPVNVSEAIVRFKEGSNRKRNEVLEDIRKVLGEQFPGVPNSTEQPLAHLLSHLLSGVTAQVAIKIYGDDLIELRRIAERTKQRIEQIDGIRDLYVEPVIEIDQVTITPKRDRLGYFGISIDQLNSTIESFIGVEPVTNFQRGKLLVPVTLRLAGSQKLTIQELRALPIHVSKGESVLLSDVALVELSRVPNQIKRENGQRRIVIQHNVAERPLSDVVMDVEAAIAPIRKQLGDSPGYSIVISGQFEAQQSAQRRILILSCVTLVLVFLILYWHFQSANLCLQVLISLPMAAIGAGLAVIITDQTLNVASLVGFVALVGIAARNGILLIDHYLSLIDQNDRKMTREILIKAGRERMIPVLMTALTSGIALLPLALEADQPGREILYPVATVLIGGLISTTLLDFIVHPGLFWHFGPRSIDRT